jgi:hypothetical protein
MTAMDSDAANDSLRQHKLAAFYSLFCGILTAKGFITS